jgi:multidrug efflux pump subunit AcrB
VARFFISHPVFAMVVALFLVLLGTIAGLGLPIAQYPKISQPTVVVSAVYPGASAKTVEESVAQPIEQQVNGVEGMKYMESTSSSAGTYRLSVTFGLERDADAAAVQVQNRVAQATADLPPGVLNAGVTTYKSTPDTLMYAVLYSPKGTYDSLFLSNYLNINVIEAIKRVPGVGSVRVFGSDFGMRIWLKPDRMAALGITSTDVAAAITDQNVQAAAGAIGQYPSAAHQAFQYGVEVHGRLVTEQEFGDIIVKADRNGGSLVHIRDIARVELGAKDYSIQAQYNGQPTASFGVSLTPEASAVAVSKLVQAQLAQLQKSFPNDLAYKIVVDQTRFVTSSLEEVVKTLAETLTLVTIVVFVFLKPGARRSFPYLRCPCRWWAPWRLSPCSASP